MNSFASLFNTLLLSVIGGDSFSILSILSSVEVSPGKSWGRISLTFLSTWDKIGAGALHFLKKSGNGGGVGGLGTTL